MDKNDPHIRSLHGCAKDNDIDNAIKLLTSNEKINSRDKLQRY